VRAAVEVQVLDWDVKLDRVGTFLGLTLWLLLNQLHKVGETVVEFDTLLSLSFFLLKLVHICEAFTRDLVVQVISSDAWLLEELDIREFLGAYQNRDPQMEMNNND
jgi:hypothetical protein